MKYNNDPYLSSKIIWASNSSCRSSGLLVSPSFPPYGSGNNDSMKHFMSLQQRDCTGLAPVSLLIRIHNVDSCETRRNKGSIRKIKKQYIYKKNIAKSIYNMGKEVTNSLLAQIVNSDISSLEISLFTICHRSLCAAASVCFRHEWFRKYPSWHRHPCCR